MLENDSRDDVDATNRETRDPFKLGSEVWGNRAWARSVGLCEDVRLLLYPKFAGHGRSAGTGAEHNWPIAGPAVHLA
jgi:hypothetical protein